MIKINIKGTKNVSLYFKNAFEELTVEEFVSFMEVNEKIKKAIEKGAKLEEELSSLKQESEDIIDALISIDAELLSVDSEVRSLKIEQLIFLSKDKDKTRNFILNTKGINERIIFQIFKEIEKGFGDFFAFFESIIPKDKFRFVDYKKRRFNLSRLTTFKIFEFNKNTVLRESAASIASSKIEGFKSEFMSNEWKNIPLFLAIITRPEKEEFEISISKKKSAFIGGKKIRFLTVSDRLNAYNLKLSEVVEKRKEIFKRLPLVVAFSIFKKYFIYKSDLIERYKILYPKKQASTATKETLKYNSEFGNEAAIEDLREASGYKQDEIYLFSVELFNKELKKFHLKTKAEAAEKERIYNESIKDKNI